MTRRAVCTGCDGRGTRVHLELGWRMAMAIEAPAHAQRAGLFDLFHVGNVSVTAFAVDPRSDMDGVIEKSVVGELVNSHPVERLSGLDAFAQGREALGVTGDEAVAIHARATRRQRRDPRDFDAGMAVAAIELELARVERVGKRNRLTRHVSHVGIGRRETVPDDENSEQRASRSETEKDPR